MMMIEEEQLQRMSFKEVWREYVDARASSAYYKQFNDELNKRIASTNLPLKRAIDVLWV